MRPTISIDIWSDIVCPWCYIGKRRFEAAVETLRDEIDVTVTYRPYQLDPTASPAKSMPVREAYARKFGGEERADQILQNVTDTAADEGIEFHMHRALRANTLLAHRLLWLAAATGGQHELKERLLKAYFTDGLDIGDPEVLATCAAEVGFDAHRVRAFLDSDDGVLEVRADLEFAANEGITAVPTFVLNGQWAVPGAQDADTFVNVLRRMASRMQSADAGD